MATSLLQTGGVASVTNTYTVSAPAVLYLQGTGHLSAADQVLVSGVTADVSASNAWKLTNPDATNWLWVRVIPLHKTGQGIPILPGETVTVVGGINSNEINALLAWGTTPGVGGSAVTIVVAGGIQKKI